MDKKKINFKKQVLPVLLIIAAIIVGFLFRDELTAILGSDGGWYDTYEAGFTVDADSTQEDASLPADETPTEEPQPEPTEPEQTTAATEASTAATTTEQATTTAVTEPSQPTEEASDEVEILYTFRTQAQYEQHYDKHGHEFTPIFGEITLEEYLMYANALIRSEDEEILTKTEKEDGDFMYFRPSTEEFLVLSTDGYIRTYFIPTAGINYWNRQ